MKTIIVTITKEKNWAGNEYLIYSTEEHGKIVELDYPTENRKLPRVYCVADKECTPDYIGFSSVTMALVGAEAVTTGYLLDRGYECTFKYPRTIKMR